jgi:hypothetical protein
MGLMIMCNGSKRIVMSAVREMKAPTVKMETATLIGEGG